MVHEFKQTTIGESCYVTDGAHSKVERKVEGIMYLTSKNIGVGTLLLDKVDYISEEDFERLFSDTAKAQRRPKLGDILTGIIGTFGNAYLYKENDLFGISSAIAILRPNHEILNSAFLFYVISSPKFKAIHSSYKSGSVQGYTNIPTIKQLPFLLPSLSTQKSIAHILGTLDDKIHLNRQINATLESMAQALFQSWFVHFDPVIDNALAEGNPIPEPLHGRAEARKALGEGRKPLPEAVRGAFPSRFVFSEEMGWIPEGWGVKPLSYIAELNPESWTSKKHPERIIYIDLANVKNGRILNRISYVFDEAPSRARRSLQKNDSIIGTVRPGNRSFAFVQEDDLTGSTGFAVLRPKIEVYRSYLYLAVTQDVMIKKFAHLADGAAYPAIRPDFVAESLIIIPSEGLLHYFDHTVSSWLQKIHENEDENTHLSLLRDTLLPKLLSGEIQIPNLDGMR